MLLSSHAALLDRGLELLQVAQQQQPGGGGFVRLSIWDFSGARGCCPPVKDGVPMPIAGTQLPQVLLL